MKIGFSILSHKKPDQVFTELIGQLNVYPDKQIAIHHDFSKAPFDTSGIEDYPVNVVKDSVRTEWSHVNNIEAILKTFELLYDQNCDWFVTLSANCYPIKHHTDIIRFLETSTVDGYIEGNSVYSDIFDFYTYFRKAFRTRYLFSIPFLRKNGTLYRKAIRSKRKDSEIVFSQMFIPYHGSDWFMINRKSMAYILNNKDKIDALVSFLRDVNKGHDLNVCPPEVVFQTLLHNNPDLVLNKNNYRYIDWTNVVNWHPNVLQRKDFEAIQQSEALFARKVDAAQSLDLIAEINTHILSA